MAKFNKFYGGSNQVARLPYETIDALQAAGFYADTNEYPDITIKSRFNDEDPDGEVILDAFSRIMCSYLEAGSIKVNGKRLDEMISSLSVPKIQIYTDVVQGNRLSNDEINKIVRANAPCILYKVDVLNKEIYSVVLIYKMLKNKDSGTFRGAEGMYIGGSKLNIKTGYVGIDQAGTFSTVNIGPLSPVKYFHSIKLTEGDAVVYINQKNTVSSTIATTARLNLLIRNSLTQGKNYNGMICATGYNAGKVVIGITIPDKTIYYSDGTTSNYTTAAVIEDTMIVADEGA